MGVRVWRVRMETRTTTVDNSFVFIIVPIKLLVIFFGGVILFNTPVNIFYISYTTWCSCIVFE